MTPKIGETVYDPACGSAGFLCEAFLYMKDILLKNMLKMQKCDLLDVLDYNEDCIAHRKIELHWALEGIVEN